MHRSIIVLALLGLVSSGAGLCAADPAAAPATREVLGVYDSRAVAYAHFWSPAEQKQRNELIARAKAARDAGDTAGFKELGQALRETQERSHLQVFSTAPADEALAALAPRLPDLLRELGVIRLVSKWDDAALRTQAGAEQRDVTDRLVREFITPDERQQKVLESMKTQKPLPLDQARAAHAGGKR